MHAKTHVFQKSKQFTGVATVYTEWVPVVMAEELLAFIKLTAQGTYTDETLNISVQTQTPDGDAIDLVGVNFSEIGNKTGSLPFLDYLGIAAFGVAVRFKIVTAGTSPDYTFKLTGWGKKA